MSLNNGGTIDQTDFITSATKNATPASDANRVSKMEADGRIDSFFTRMGAPMTYGETINGGTLPTPVYIDSSNGKVMVCDANVSTKLAFYGFSIVNGVLNDIKSVRSGGIVGGFSGLTAGIKYYLSDTAGAITSTPGTYEVYVGTAVSATEIFIQKGPQYANGTVTLSATGTTSITLGFRPSRIRVHALWASGSASAPGAESHGGWSVNGGNNCAFLSRDNTSNMTGGVSSDAWHIVQNSNSPVQQVGTITTITDSGFTLNNIKTGTMSPVYLFWEAEGII